MLINTTVRMLLLLCFLPMGVLAAPNFIIILSDDQGLPSTSRDTYGGTFATPSIDRMADQGMRFTHAFAEPLCRATRAALLSGLYGSITGVTSNMNVEKFDPARYTPLSKALQDLGYTTGHVGKWHLTSYFYNKQVQQRWGWDYSYAAPQATGMYWRPTIVDNGKKVATTARDYGPDMLQAAALRFIRANQHGPFFLYYAIPLPHGPFVKTPITRAGASPKDIYADYLRYADRQVGELMTELDRLGIQQNTLVIYVGDNGSINNSRYLTPLVHGRRIDGHKNTLKEGGSRVPFLASWPGTISQGTQLNDLVHIVDLYPTLVSLAGGHPDTGLSGVSFAPQLRSQRGTPRESLDIQLGSQGYTRYKTRKIYDGGLSCDMRDAPYREICE